MIKMFESLDQIYPIRRVETDKPYIYDEWEFDEGSRTFTVRFVRARRSLYGPKVTQIEFGQRRAKTIKKTLVGVKNVRKYIATVISVIEQALENSTMKMKPKSHGIALVIDVKLFEERGSRILRILKRRFRNTLKFHESFFTFEDLDNVNAIYAWKKERSFRSVFTGNAFDDAGEPDDIEFRDLPSKTVSDMISVDKNDKDEQELEDKENLLVKAQLEPSVDIPKTNVEKVRELKKEYEPITEADFDKDLYLESVIALNLFETRIPSFRKSSFSQDKNSMGENETIQISDKVIKNFLAKEVKNSEASSDILSLYEYILALNLRGIKTNYIYDYYDNYGKNGYRNSFRSYFTRENIDITKLNIPSEHRKNVSFQEIMSVVRNARQILEENDLDISNFDRTSHTFKPISNNKTLSSIVHDSKLSKKKSRDLYKSMIASIPEHEIEHFNPYKYEKSSGNKKIVKEKKYSEEGLIGKVLDMNIHNIIDMSDDLDDFKEILEIMPSFTQSFFSDDIDYFEVSWVSNWTLSGGSRAQYVAAKTSYDLEINEQLGSFWHPDMHGDDDLYDEALEDPELGEKIRSNFKKLYDKNQDFFRQKFKKKYDTKTIKLYRGIGLSAVDTYIPGALESWTSSIATAKRFAKMMSKKNENYTILIAEVPIQHIFGSFESFAETWPGEEDLKGKKEYIVMGGTFATTPLYVYDEIRKETKQKLKPFKEWILYEGSNMKKKKINIKTPLDIDFDRILSSKKVALGNDPKEHEIRKSEKDKSDE